MYAVTNFAILPSILRGCPFIDHPGQRGTRQDDGASIENVEQTRLDGHQMLEDQSVCTRSKVGQVHVFQADSPERFAEAHNGSTLR
jgi:hypothetical protein